MRALMSCDALGMGSEQLFELDCFCAERGVEMTEERQLCRQDTKQVLGLLCDTVRQNHWTLVAALGIMTPIGIRCVHLQGGWIVV